MLRVVLGVPALVEQRREVLAPADPRDHQVDLVRHPHRRAERPRGLRRPLLRVEDDVRLCREIEAHPGHRLRERRRSAARRERIVERRRAEQARQVGPPHVLEPDARPPRAAPAPRCPGRRPPSRRGTPASARAAPRSRSRAAPSTPPHSDAHPSSRTSWCARSSASGAAGSDARRAARRRLRSISARTPPSGSFACSHRRPAVGDLLAADLQRQRRLQPASSCSSPRSRPPEEAADRQLEQVARPPPLLARQRPAPARAGPRPPRARTARRGARRSPRPRSPPSAREKCRWYSRSSSVDERLGPRAVAVEVLRHLGLRTIGQVSAEAAQSEVARERIRPAAPRRDLELEIEGIAYGGRGVARRDGYVVFVAGGLPGDRVRAEVTKLEAELRRGDAPSSCCGPSADRIPDACVHEGEPCPGAPWQGLPYERQLADKQRPGRRGAAPDRRPRRLRARADRPRRRASGATATSSSTPSAQRDAGARPRLPRPRPLGPGRRRRRLPARLRARQRGPQRGPRAGPVAQELPPYDRRAGDGVLRNLVVREGRRTGRAADPPRHLPGVDPAPAGRPPHRDRGTIRRHRRPDRRARRRDDPRRSSAASSSRSPTAPSSRRTPRWPSASTASPPSSPGSTGTERVFDLYCGIGTIGLTLARSAGEVWGLELRPRRSPTPSGTPQRNGIDNAHFVAGRRPHRRSARCIERGRASPTSSSSTRPAPASRRRSSAAVIECEAKRIVYVSCNPTTLAPNAAQLDEAGYRLRRVRPVDMFPQTPHIECVALLERADA